MEFIVKNTVTSEHTRDLLNAKGEAVNGVVEWTVAGSQLTELEKQALRRKHGSRTPNYVRAAEVKKLMNEGRKCNEIVQALCRKYGQTMIKRDHAALSGRGVLKNTVKKV